MRSCKPQISRLAFIVFLLSTLLSSAAFADKKSDLYTKGIKSMNAGNPQDIMDARDAFCQVSKEDAEYSDGTNKNAKQLCDEMRPL